MLDEQINLLDILMIALVPRLAVRGAPDAGIGQGSLGEGLGRSPRVARRSANHGDALRAEDADGSLSHVAGDEVGDARLRESMEAISDLHPQPSTDGMTLSSTKAFFSSNLKIRNSLQCQVLVYSAIRRNGTAIFIMVSPGSILSICPLSEIAAILSMRIADDRIK